MIAADRAGPASAGCEAAGRRCARDASVTPRAATSSTLLRPRRPGGRQRRRDAAGEPDRQHVPSGDAIEVRLAGRRSLVGGRRVGEFSAVVFGAGDLPHAAPRIGRRRRRSAPGDRLALGPLSATVDGDCSATRGWCRCGSTARRDAIWAGIARHGRPIQYAHMPAPLALWDVWTAIAGPPVAFEPPSAGFVLDWAALAAMRDARRRVRDDHPRGRHFVHRRRRAGRAAAVRRALRHSRGDGTAIARARAEGGASSRSARPSCVRSNTRRRAVGR